jgi:hypothetical protein
MTEILDTDNQFYRGVKFEIMFAEFMKSDLGWDGYAIRSQQKGKSNNKGAQVDIIAKRYDIRGKNLVRLSYAYLGLMVVAAALGLYYDENLVIIFGFFTGALAIFLAYKSQDMHRENAWVECKNRKGKATFEQVQKCINEYNDYVASGDKEFKFVEWYFVSASGFVENALKLALDKGFTCYEFKNNKFEKVTYWK